MTDSSKKQLTSAQALSIHKALAALVNSASTNASDEDAAKEVASWAVSVKKLVGFVDGYIPDDLFTPASRGNHLRHRALVAETILSMAKDFLLVSEKLAEREQAVNKVAE